ncbi:signal peptidase I [Sporosarcina sp. SAFN-015]|uniref:signal peptidase I n=1 Tax=Sporosarcina sp. SAFN-015 TaxID=3387274 RepID=UPI003F7DF881
MKRLSKVFNILLLFVILLTLSAAVGSAIMKKPILLTVIRSDSMVPVWERGDMVVIKNVGKKDTINVGDIVFFTTDKGSLATKGWIAHRVMEGNDEEGFITKGDANKQTDQESAGSGLIKREWIAAKAVTIGDSPLVIPKAGYFSLWMEKYQGNPYVLPVFAVILALLIGIGELKSGRRHKKKNKGMDLQLIYIGGGFVIAMIMGGTMLASSQHVKLIYEVSETSKGVLMGSSLGILQVGDVITQPLSELRNDGFIPSIGVITTNDNQIDLSHERLNLTKGQLVEAEYTLHAEKPGKYETAIRVGIFYPFLPSSVIYFLAQKSYWLALIIISIIPGLPLMVYPFIDRKMRRRMVNVFRKKSRKFRGAFPF